VPIAALRDGRRTGKSPSLSRASVRLRGAAKARGGRCWRAPA